MHRVSFGRLSTNLLEAICYIRPGASLPIDARRKISINFGEQIRLVSIVPAQFTRCVHSSAYRFVRERSWVELAHRFDDLRLLRVGQRTKEWKAQETVTDILGHRMVTSSAPIPEAKFGEV